MKAATCGFPGGHELEHFLAFPFTLSRTVCWCFLSVVKDNEFVFENVNELFFFKRDKSSTSSDDLDFRLL